MSESRGFAITHIQCVCFSCDYTARRMAAAEDMAEALRLGLSELENPTPVAGCDCMLCLMCLALERWDKAGDR